MSKKFRDYLFIVFIVLFLFLTVGISLYASGYKLNPSWPLKFNRLLLKTGMLAVATEPAQAVIYLNDKPQKDLSLKPWKKDYLTTPKKIKNLLPGEYDLRLERDGYWPYQQKIKINSGETTFAEDINLFRENIPLLILAMPENNLTLSPDKKYLYADQAKKIIALKNESSRTLEFSGNAGGTWLKNNKLMAAGIIFDPTKENNDINYSSLIGTGARNWYFEETTGNLYYQNNNSLNRLEINNKTNTLLLSGDNYLSYEPKQDKLFVITETQNQIKLKSYSLKNYQLESTWALPSSGHYTFHQEISGYLGVYDNQNRTLYLFIPTDLNAGPTIIQNINNWASLDNQSLIYTNDFEIYIFNFSTGRADLITRRSERIKEIIWNSTGNYLIFSGDDTLNVLDFKNRNTTVLFRAEKIMSPILDEKNNNLYFWARVDKQEGIYKMLMQ